MTIAAKAHQRRRPQCRRRSTRRDRALFPRLPRPPGVAWVKGTRRTAAMPHRRPLPAVLALRRTPHEAAGCWPHRRIAGTEPEHGQPYQLKTARHVLSGRDEGTVMPAGPGAEELHGHERAGLEETQRSQHGAELAPGAVTHARYDDARPPECQPDLARCRGVKGLELQVELARRRLAPGAAVNRRRTDCDRPGNPRPVHSQRT